MNNQQQQAFLRYCREIGAEVAQTWVNPKGVSSYGLRWMLTTQNVRLTFSDTHVLGRDVWSKDRDFTEVALLLRTPDGAFRHTVWKQKVARRAASLREIARQFADAQRKFSDGAGVWTPDAVENWVNRVRQVAYSINPDRLFAHINHPETEEALRAVVREAQEFLANYPEIQPPDSLVKRLEDAYHLNKRALEELEERQDHEVEELTEGEKEDFIKQTLSSFSPPDRVLN